MSLIRLYYLSKKKFTKMNLDRIFSSLIMNNVWKGGLDLPNKVLKHRIIYDTLIYC